LIFRGVRRRPNQTVPRSSCRAVLSTARTERGRDGPQGEMRRIWFKNLGAGRKNVHVHVGAARENPPRTTSVERPGRPTRGTHERNGENAKERPGDRIPSRLAPVSVTARVRGTYLRKKKRDLNQDKGGERLKEIEIGFAQVVTQGNPSRKNKARGQEGQ